MSYPETFEGWAAHDKDCVKNGSFKKTQYKPKVSSLLLRIVNCGPRGGSNSVLMSVTFLAFTLFPSTHIDRLLSSSSLYKCFPLGMGRDRCRYQDQILWYLRF
jgi:hypothetical protein